MVMDQLIPGLPDDISLQCLIRLPYKHLSTASSVSSIWNLHIQLPDFLLHRKAAGFSTNLIATAQSPPQPSTAKPIPPAGCSRLTLYQPGSESWSELPPVPWLAHGLPVYCGLAGVGAELVVMGGYDPDTWESSNAVFVYNVISATWRRGARMPGVRRSFFGCASDSNRMVLIAGGHDDDKNALRSALVYDVANDKWLPLSDMSMERDECKVAFHRGKFHVIGGYQTETQGRFETSVEAFDVDSWQWEHATEDVLETDTCPRTCVVGHDGKMYTWKGRDMLEKRDATWQLIAKLPDDVSDGFHLTTWRDKLIVIGSSQKTYKLDSKSYTWIKLATLLEYSGCCLET